MTPPRGRPNALLPLKLGSVAAGSNIFVTVQIYLETILLVKKYLTNKLIMMVFFVTSYEFTIGVPSRLIFKIINLMTFSILMRNKYKIIRSTEKFKFLN